MVQTLQSLAQELRHVTATIPREASGPVRPPGGKQPRRCFSAAELRKRALRRFSTRLDLLQQRAETAEKKAQIIRDDIASLRAELEAM